MSSKETDNAVLISAAVTLYVLGALWCKATMKGRVVASFIPLEFVILGVCVPLGTAIISSFPSSERNASSGVFDSMNAAFAIIATKRVLAERYPISSLRECCVLLRGCRLFSREQSVDSSDESLERGDASPREGTPLLETAFASDSSVGSGDTMPYELDSDSDMGEGRPLLLGRAPVSYQP